MDKYQSNISPHQSLLLIENLKRFEGAINYDGSCSAQVMFQLANGKTLRFCSTDDDCGNAKLHVDQYPGLAIKDANDNTKYI